MRFFRNLRYPGHLGVALSLGILSVSPLSRAEPPVPFDFDPSLVEQWKESAVSPPPYPQPENLVSVPPMPTDSLRVAVDRASVSRVEDRVLRYTLVIDSSGGARNVLFEGIRCETREYKTYAIGTTEKNMKPLDQATWRSITYLPRNAFRWQLYKFHACDAHSSARSPREFLDSLSTNRQP